MDFSLSEDLRSMQELAREFTEEKIAPHADKWDEERHYPAEIVTEMEGEVNELTDLVNELVAAAVGSTEERPAERVELATLVVRTAARIARRRHRLVAVRIDEAVTGAEVVAVAPLLERAVANLVDNACKFDEGTEPIVVAIQPAAFEPPPSTIVSAPNPPPTPNWVAVRVVDHGAGIPGDDLPHVFDRFHRSDAARGLPGSGLGLAIVCEMALAAGGRVVASNGVDVGAIVGFDLPIVGDLDDPADAVRTFDS